MLGLVDNPLPQHLRERGSRMLECLKGLTSNEQLEMVCRTLVAVMMATRDTVSGSAESRTSYGAICDAVECWLTQELSQLRFHPN